MESAKQTKRENPKVTYALAYVTEKYDSKYQHQAARHFGKKFNINRNSAEALYNKVCVMLGKTPRVKDAGKYEPRKQTPTSDLFRLRVKIKSLGVESQIIRREELRAKREYRFVDVLHRHRTVELREESRAAYVAYGYIRGIRYSEVEQNPRWKWPADRVAPNWKRVADIVWEFGPTETRLAMYAMDAVSKAPLGARDRLAKEALLDKIRIWRGN
jgi:hypothetical protein